jgi:hypothetical protein
VNLGKNPPQYADRIADDDGVRDVGEHVAPRISRGETLREGATYEPMKVDANRNLVILEPCLKLVEGLRIEPESVGKSRSHLGRIAFAKRG